MNKFTAIHFALCLSACFYHSTTHAIPLPTEGEEEKATQSVQDDGIVRQYVDRGKLTKQQEKTVIELAKKCGIERVAKIQTFYLRPSAHQGISVFGVEQVKGREVSYKVLQVNFKGWTHEGATPKEKDNQIGDFWAGKAWDRKSTILKVGEKDFRISSPHGLAAEQCEAVLKQLQSGKFSLGPGARKEFLSGIDWNKPKSFGKFGERTSVSFSNGDGHYSLSLSVTKDKIVINEIMLAMP